MDDLERRTLRDRILTAASGVRVIEATDHPKQIFCVLFPDSLRAKWAPVLSQMFMKRIKVV